MKARSAIVAPRLSAYFAAGIFCAAQFLVPSVTHAQSMNSLPAAWAHWKYFRTINLPQVKGETLVKVRVPVDVFAHSQDNLEDLRVTDDMWRETPFVLHVEGGWQNIETRSSRQLESSYVPGQYTQTVLDLGKDAPFHNHLFIGTPQSNFIAWTQIELSDDAHTWRKTGQPEAIYRFRDKDVNGNQFVAYPETNARYLRLRIYNRIEKFPIERLAVQYTVSVPQEEQAVAIPFATVPQADKSTSVWRGDLSYALPLNRIHVATTSEEYYRNVAIYSSADNDNWQLCSMGKIYSFLSSAPPDASGTISPVSQIHSQNEYDFSFCTARHWRVEIQNGNDSPLENISLQLSMTARDAYFHQASGRKYFLLYGQSEANAPQYDISQTVNPQQLRAAQASLGIGAEEINTAWTDPRPWTEQHQAVLWIGAILAALLLAFTALRSLKSAGSQSQSR